MRRMLTKDQLKKLVEAYQQTEIDDSVISLDSTWSSSKINEELDELDIPTKTSDLENDSGFIDKDVNNLSNYTKTSDLIENGKIKVSLLPIYEGN